MVGAVAAVAYSLVIIAALLLPETNAKELAVYARGELLWNHHGLQ